MLISFFLIFQKLDSLIKCSKHNHVNANGMMFKTNVGFNKI